jgi:uncharacterized protein YecE (DUF72 family)
LPQIQRSFQPQQTPADGRGLLRYFRLHGSPHIYYSSYDEAFRTALAARLTALNSADSNIWCIFDNTAQGAAIENGLDVDAKVRSVR